MTLPASTAPDHAMPPSPRKISTINSVTGLSTDYLNHFTEAVMALEMAGTMPDCLEDLRSWQPKTYVEHFAASRFPERDEVIAAYHSADPMLRDALDTIAATMNAILVQVRDTISARLDAGQFAEQSAARLKPLLARAAALINGGGKSTDGAGQAAVDALFRK